MEVNKQEITGDILTFYIKAETFPEGIDDTFKKLGELIKGFDDREAYGVSGCFDGALTYRACVKEQYPREAEKYNLPYYNIPKGKYLCTILKDWREHLPEINQIFHQLMENLNTVKGSICLEYYKNEEEALLMVQGN